MVKMVNFILCIFYHNKKVSLVLIFIQPLSVDTHGQNLREELILTSKKDKGIHFHFC